MGHLLQPRAVADIRIARQRARQEGSRAETPGRVVAELNFGFWRYLLANHYDRTLWRGALYQAFPRRSRRVARNAVEALHLARNRMAHHEPMFNRPIADIHHTALKVAGWICPISAAWIKECCHTTQMLRRRPT